MTELPQWLEKLLSRLGINTGRLNWKLHYLDKWWEENRPAFLRKGTPAGRRYKYCRCGQMMLAEDTRCAACGRRLPSLTRYRIQRALALNTPEMGWVTMIFLGLIVVLYAMQVFFFGPRALLAPTTEGLIWFGAFRVDLFMSGDYWRILTMALAHIGIIHIVFNVMAISFILPRLERQLGIARTIILITLTQIGAVIAHKLYYPPFVTTAGASGVAFGLIGFGLASTHRIKDFATRAFYIQWTFYGILFGILVGANNTAHIGGFVIGALLGTTMHLGFIKDTTRAMYNLFGWIGGVLWCAALLYLLAHIFSTHPSGI